MGTTTATATDAFSQMIRQAVRAEFEEHIGRLSGKSDRLMTTKQAANYLALSVRTVKQLTSNGELHLVRSGGRVMLDIRDLDRWIEDHKE